MTKRGIVIYLACVGLLILPFLYSFSSRRRGTFWDAMFGNMMAEVMALIGGIPIALLIDNVSKRGESRGRVQAERKREKELLLSIKEELSFSDDRLNERIKNPNTLPAQPLKTDLWQASCDSGLIGLIKDPLLLNRISSAYYNLNMVKRMEEHYYQTLVSKGVTIADANKLDIDKKLLKEARSFDNLLKDRIGEAQKLIEDRVKNL